MRIGNLQPTTIKHLEQKIGVNLTECLRRDMDGVKIYLNLNELAYLYNLMKKEDEK